MVGRDNVDMTKAAEILDAIRTSYPRAAIVREVCLTDPMEHAIYARWIIENSPSRDYYKREYQRKGTVIADSIPEGWVPHESKTTRRIDALMRDSQGYTAIEIKVSRADFKRETEGKRRAWRAHTRRFIYAVPQGLLLPEEIPTGCGLWEIIGNTIKVSKKASINKNVLPFPQSFYDALLYRVSNYEKSGE